jgi:hypothetical protein
MRFLIFLALTLLCFQVGSLVVAVEKIAANAAVVQKPTTNRQSTPLQDSIVGPVYIMDSNGVHLP